MFVLNGVSHSSSTSRSYLLRSILPGGVFAAVAGDNLTDQLEVLVVHVGHFFTFSPRLFKLLRRLAIADTVPP